MISIYLCDDEQIWIKRLDKAIADYQIKSDWDLQIKQKCSSPSSLLENVMIHTPSHGIYFLDINFKCSDNGLDLAKKIRTIDPDADIIFVTTHDEMVLETFRLKLAALDYIMKDSDDFEEQIHSCLFHIEMRYRSAQKHSSSITIHAEGSYISILQDEIYYIETISESHKIRMHLASAFYDLSDSLSRLQKELGENFVLCSKSCLVNCLHIRERNIKQKKLLLDNGESCVCSFRMWKRFSHSDSLKK